VTRHRIYGCMCDDCTSLEAQRKRQKADRDYTQWAERMEKKSFENSTRLR
jgi:hypothetical protein